MSSEKQWESVIQYSESGERCDICGSSESLSPYVIESSSGETHQSLLCPRHYRVANILGSGKLQEPSDLDENLQESGKITIRVPKALIEASDSAAEKQEQTRSEFVRDSLELAILAQEIDNEFDEILLKATNIKSPDESNQNVEFLENRIRKLESLLEDAIGKM